MCISIYGDALLVYESCSVHGTSQEFSIQTLNAFIPTIIAVVCNNYYLDVFHFHQATHA